MDSSTQTAQPAPVFPPANDKPILEINDLHTYFFLERGTVRAVDGVNLTLGRQSTLGVVGESGCGKSVTAMSIMRLIKDPPGRIVKGEILLPVGWLLVSWALGWVPLAGPTLGAASFSFVMAGYAMLAVVWASGVVNALRARMSPLFLVGKWGERLFVRLYPESVVESST